MRIVLIVAGVGVYWNGLSGPFVFDDLDVIEGNPSIRSPATAWIPIGDDGSTVAGRPFVNLTLAVNYAFGGLEPAGYRAVNVIIHLATALGIFALLREWLDRTRVLAPDRLPADPRTGVDGRSVGRPGVLDPVWLAGSASLLWLVHPLNTSAVTYVAQRAESLAALFIVLTVLGFLRGLRTGRLAWLWASAASCLLGVLTKETAAVAPLLVLLLDRTLGAGNFRAALRLRWGYYLSLAGSWVVLGWLVAGAGGRGGTAGFDAGVSVWNYGLTQFDAIVRYLGLAIWPRGLVFDYGTGVASQLTQVAGQVLAVAMLVAVAGWLAWKRSAAGLAGLFFFVLLAPSSSVVPVATQTIAEHRMYLPLAAVAGLAVAGLFRLAGGHARWICVALAVALGTGTVSRNRVYQSELTLWEDTVRKRPDNGRAQANLGEALMEAGREGEALLHLTRAIELRPDLAAAHYNLGLIYADRGEMAAAELAYAAAAQYDARRADARLNLGIILMETGRHSRALPLLAEAVRLEPELVEAHVAYGNALAQSGDLTRAAVEHEAALRLAPDSVIANYNYGNVLLQLRRDADAAVHYRRALERQPRHVSARYYLAVILARGGDRAGALREIEQVIAIQPGHAGARQLWEQVRVP